MNHNIVKIGLGIGLMAASSSAMAIGSQLGLHGFGSSMVFAKPGGSNPLYATFVPSGNQSTDAVILVELTQGSGTAPGTWTYYVSNGSLNTAGNVPGMAYTYPLSSVSSNSIWSITASTAASGYAGTSWWGEVGNGAAVASGSSNSASASSTNGEILMQFSYSSIASSQTCSISFNAYVGTDDYMQYQIQAFNTGNSASGWNSILGASSTAIAAANAYTMTTKSGGAATDTTSGTNFGADFAGNGAGYGTSMPVIPTYSYAILSLHNGPAANPTLTGTSPTGAGVFKTFNTCSSMTNSRLALNSSGLVVGGKVGMLRIW